MMKIRVFHTHMCVCVCVLNKYGKTAPDIPQNQYSKPLWRDLLMTLNQRL